ncbi:pentatricopeptide repeat-containing protein At2g02980, chloroplastic-like isoform X2 [Magnolia sinica]|uniref:pentatricopeptide repeat-containing protein At2g02980, chloroplastic-like isoform X2 n=1 Tax=Magnolia sinica TaxID=86752 RepID=UPI00265A7E0D|nr:pentatricopeptide repeat-containing protein At2g02980, chloroplastic-like isoform X2 [Magnolia sinica]
MYRFLQLAQMEGMQLYILSLQSRSDSSSLIGGYLRTGDIVSARCLFDQMVEREVVAWTAMISDYAKNGEPGEAIKLFHMMLVDVVKPDEVVVCKASLMTVTGTQNLLVGVRSLASLYCSTYKSAILGFRFSVLVVIITFATWITLEMKVGGKVSHPMFMLILLA